MIFEKKRHIIDTLFAIILLFLFAFCVLTLISLGASVYRRNVNTMTENFTDRISFAYITEKMRQGDINGGISVGNLENVPAITLEEEINGISYTTYLYKCDGYLCELLKKTEATGISPSSGQKIIEITDFSFNRLNDNIYRITITEAGEDTITFYVASRSQKGSEIE